MYKNSFQVYMHLNNIVYIIYLEIYITYTVYTSSPLHPIFKQEKPDPKTPRLQDIANQR